MGIEVCETTANRGGKFILGPRQPLVKKHENRGQNESVHIIWVNRIMWILRGYILVGMCEVLKNKA